MKRYTYVTREKSSKLSHKLTEHERIHKRKASQILYNPAHPLNEAFQKLPSGRHLMVPLARKNHFKKSLILSAILTLNAKFNVKCIQRNSRRKNCVMF